MGRTETTWDARRLPEPGYSNGHVPAEEAAMLKRLVSMTVALAVVALLASCGPLSWIPRPHGELAADRMLEIVEAVNNQDAGALKEMFTEYARAEYSDEIDDGLQYLLSMFPDGDLVWEDPDYRPGYSQAYHDGKATILVGAGFQVSSGGTTTGCTSPITR
jgi:hypothetical protein